MINAKDVVKLKVPYPFINSGLAKSAHMYICKASSVSPSKYELVKCQTYKPCMKALKHYCIEKPDKLRNPFAHTTLIDCDKLFILKDIVIDDSLKTSVRPDVCDDLFSLVIKELQTDGYKSVVLNKNDVMLLNSYVTNK